MDELAQLHHDQVFLRREAIQRGYDDRDLRRSVLAGVLYKVRHGAYVPASVWAAADDLERHRLRSHAVLRSHGSALALSHTSAAVEHGLRLHDPDLSRVHVTCLDDAIAKTTPDVTYHRAACTDRDLVETDHGELVVVPVRAALEAASLATVPSGLVVLDSVVDLGHASVDEVLGRFSTFSGPGARRLQVTVRLVRQGANSHGESLSRHLFWRQHLPEPVLQYEVRDDAGNLLGRCDFAWPEYGLLGEFDGRTKYGRLLRGSESVEDVVVREKRREDLIREVTNWLMIRLVWADLFTPEVTAARIRRQMALGKRLLAA